MTDLQYDTGLAVYYATYIARYVNAISATLGNGEASRISHLMLRRGDKQ